MRVLQINDYPVDHGGGAEVLLARTMGLLRDTGANVELFCAADLPDRRQTAGRYLDNVVARRALAERLRSYRPDVVHLHNFYHVLSPGILAELQRYRASRTQVVPDGFLQTLCLFLAFNAVDGAQRSHNHLARG